MSGTDRERTCQDCDIGVERKAGSYMSTEFYLGDELDFADMDSLSEARRLGSDHAPQRLARSG